MPLDKLYVHYEGVDKAEFTKVIRLSGAPQLLLVNDLTSAFCSGYNEKQGPKHPLDPSGVQAVDSKGKTLDPKARLDKVLSNLDDVFMQKLPESVEPLPTEAGPGPGSAGTEARSGRGVPSPSGSAPVQNTHAKSAPITQAEQLHEVLQPYLQKAELAIKSQNFKAAKDIYEQLLQMLPGNADVMLKLAETWLVAGKPNKGAEWARRSIDVRPGDSTAHELLAMALLKTGSAAAAVDHFEIALGECKKASEGSEREGQLQLGLAQALYDTKESMKQDLAASLVMELLQEDEENWDCLFMYARIALDRELRQDAIRVVLRLLVHRSADVGARQLLADCLVDAESGIEDLMGELHTGESSPAALAFIATCVKDHGAIPAAIMLLRKAAQLDPQHTSYTLNLLHALELEQRFDEVVEVTIRMCKATKLKLGGGLELQDITALLDDLPPFGSITQQSWLHAAEWKPAGRQEKVSKELKKVSYSVDELDLLAILFTLVKVLFTGGALTHACKLSRLIEPARIASAVELHTTLIRNEAAYFGCVLQLINEHPPPPVLEGAQKPLFLLGDSHCLSPGWRHVVVHGEQRLLHPLLVTGCKLWHLRPESNFYPKMQLLNVVAQLPDDAQVIVMLGEIDCREGLLLAEQKCKYEDLDEGINHTIQIYIDVLLSLIKDRNFELIVHPVAPVLNETRHIVKPFAKALRRKMLEAAALPQAKGRLHYMDFFDKLLSPSDPSKFNPELAFDGTHMAPAYLTFMQESLDATMPAQ